MQADSGGGVNTWSKRVAKDVPFFSFLLRAGHRPCCIESTNAQRENWQVFWIE